MKKISARKREQVWNMTEGRCAYCGCDLGERWHVDHVIPQAQGGSNRLGNLVPACQACNMSKGGRDPEEWRMALLMERPAWRFIEKLGPRLERCVKNGWITTEDMYRARKAAWEMYIALEETELAFWFEQVELSIPAWEERLDE